MRVVAACGLLGRAAWPKPGGARPLRRGMSIAISRFAPGPSVHQLELLIVVTSSRTPLCLVLLSRWDPSTVRYAVHPYFVQRRGWPVAGLEPAGGAENATVSDSIMKARAPAYIGRLMKDPALSGSLSFRVALSMFVWCTFLVSCLRTSVEADPYCR